MFRQISLMRAVSRLAPLCYKAARFVKLYADVRRFSARAAARGDSRDVAERGAGALKFRHHGGARRVPPRARAFAPEVLVLENYENLAKFSKEQLIDFCVAHMASEQWPAEQVRAHMEAVVPHLKHWK